MAGHAKVKKPRETREEKTEKEEPDDETPEGFEFAHHYDGLTHD